MLPQACLFPQLLCCSTAYCALWTPASMLAEEFSGALVLLWAGKACVQTLQLREWAARAASCD